MPKEVIASVPFTVRIPEDLYKQLQEAKWSQQKSITKLVELAIKEFVGKTHRN